MNSDKLKFPPFSPIENENLYKRILLIERRVSILNIEEELTSFLSEELSKEIDKQILNNIINGNFF